MALPNTQPSFDAPIPGQAMVSELGARPWQQPSQYTTIEEAVDFYISKMSSDDVAIQIEDILEMGVSVADLAHVIQLSNVMEGVHSIDVGVLATPVLIEFIMLIGDSADIDYKTGLDEQSETVKKSMMNRAIKKFKEKEKQTSVESEDPIDESENSSKDDKINQLTGLMARRV